MDFLAVKTDQVQQCFPSNELLGWYSVGASASETDIALHKQITEVNDNPLFVLLDPEESNKEPPEQAKANAKVKAQKVSLVSVYSSMQLARRS